MFNNIIYFIVVLLIFNISFPDTTQEKSAYYNLGMLFMFWMTFAGYCRLCFRRLLVRFSDDGDGAGRLINDYHVLILRLSILAVFLFCLDVYLFHLKYWIQMIPGLKYLSVLQGIPALATFITYLATIWYFSHPVYMLLFNAHFTRVSFIISNLRFNLPILFPWLVLSLVYDLITLSPWSGPGSFIDRPEGQMLFFAIFLSLLMVFMPPFIQYWWGCKPLQPSDRINELKRFFSEMRFRYRGIMRWPIFEGRMATAGIMGIIPRFRYILVTDSLMEILTMDELKAVMAHEVGHAKYRHLLFYIIFFLGYMVLSFGSFDLFFYFLASYPSFFEMLGGGNSGWANLFYLLLSIPILITMVVYFRFVMGFFMRNFERQADLHSAVVMGSPKPTISSLEKIALLSGKSRELPSWHHFSIRERVEYLWRILGNPRLVKSHNTFVASSFIVYLICIICLGYLLNFSALKQDLNFRMVSKVITQELERDPENILLLQDLAMAYHKMERYQEALELYERLLFFGGDQAVTLNNLAWLLVTTPDMDLQDPPRAIFLARKAVELDRIPQYLDTLAEAYYVSGDIDKAREIIKEAISAEPGNTKYYEKQLKKYMKASEN